MMTPSHFLMTAAVDAVLKARGQRPQSAAFLTGSVLPDLPLYVLSVGYIGWHYYVAPALFGIAAPAEHIFGAGYDTHYFTDPWWIIPHNTFHAPLILLALAALGAWATRQGHRWGPALLWFAAGCAFHAGVDILTHRDDGPLLFFPLDWQYRFPAPISYWDRRYGAELFAPLERALDGVIVIGFAARWMVRRVRQWRPTP